jgi:hypothetical protein
LKLNKKYKYIVYKLSDDYKEIVVEHASEDKDWEEFREKLINATSKSRTVRPAHELTRNPGKNLTGCRALSARVLDTPSTTLSTAWPLATVSGAFE